MEINGEQLLTMEQAATHKGVPYGTLLSAVNRGQIPSVRIPALGRRRLFKVPDVDAWKVSSRGGCRPGAGRKKGDG